MKHYSPFCFYFYVYYWKRQSLLMPVFLSCNQSISAVLFILNICNWLKFFLTQYKSLCLWVGKIQPFTFSVTTDWLYSIPYNLFCVHYLFHPVSFFHLLVFFFGGGVTWPNSYYSFSFLSLLIWKLSWLFSLPSVPTYPWPAVFIRYKFC